MNALQDVREAEAQWHRVFSGKREPVRLRVGRCGAVFTLLLGKASHILSTIIQEFTHSRVYTPMRRQ